MGNPPPAPVCHSPGPPREKVTPIPRSSGLSQADAKKKVAELIGSGMKVADAMKAVGRTTKTYENWRNQDKDFVALIEASRDRVRRAAETGKDVDLYNLTFAEWRKRFLHRDTYPHMHDMIKAVEGELDEPHHPAIDWDQRNKSRVIINIPPFHAKSQLITADYVLYKLCMNPNFRVLIISSKAEFSKKFIHQIRQRMTSTLFTELQAAYAPEGGWKPQKGEGAFSNNQLYIAGRDADEKDPNVEAVGIGGSIYGSRADLAILDDVVVGTNAAEYEKQIYWLESELENRLFNGKIIIVGTRLASVDMYSELRNGDRYLSGESPWSYLRMPMVLEEHQEPENWVTLWPKSYQPMDANEPGEQDADGMYTAHDWERAYRTKNSKPPKVWSLVYQQMDVPDDATFHPTAVRGSVEGRRKPGPLIAGALGHPAHGAEGMRVIGSIDPAGTGDAFILVYAVDRTTRKRYVLNCWKGENTIPSWYRQQIEAITEEYGVQEWVIEAQAYSNWIYHDEP